MQRSILLVWQMRRTRESIGKNVLGARNIIIFYVEARKPLQPSGLPSRQDWLSLEPN